LKSKGASGDDNTGPTPFASVGESLLTLFRMVLGNFDRNWFLLGSPALSAMALVLFVLYMFIVFIVLLNILIAVVIDKYDFAYYHSKSLFLRSRLTLMASLELQGLTRSITAQGRLASEQIIEPKNRNSGFGSANATATLGNTDSTINIPISSCGIDKASQNETPPFDRCEW